MGIFSKKNKRAEPSLDEIIKQRKKELSAEELNALTQKEKEGKISQREDQEAESAVYERVKRLIIKAIKAGEKCIFENPDLTYYKSRYPQGDRRVDIIRIVHYLNQDELFCGKVAFRYTTQRSDYPDDDRVFKVIEIKETMNKYRNRS